MCGKSCCKKVSICRGFKKDCRRNSGDFENIEDCRFRQNCNKEASDVITSLQVLVKDLERLVVDYANNVPVPVITFDTNIVNNDVNFSNNVITIFNNHCQASIPNVLPVVIASPYAKNMKKN
jgi:hypothetical protein